MISDAEIQKAHNVNIFFESSYFFMFQTKSWLYRQYVYQSQGDWVQHPNRDVIDDFRAEIKS